MIAQRALGTLENVVVQVIVHERVVQRNDVGMVDGLHERLLLLPVFLDNLLGSLRLLHLCNQSLSKEVRAFKHPSKCAFAKLLADRIFHLCLVADHCTRTRPTINLLVADAACNHEHSRRYLIPLSPGVGKQIVAADNRRAMPVRDKNAINELVFAATSKFFNDTLAPGIVPITLPTPLGAAVGVPPLPAPAPAPDAPP
jgi:hypothetical protein